MKNRIFPNQGFCYAPTLPAVQLTDIGPTDDLVWAVSNLFTTILPFLETLIRFGVALGIAIFCVLNAGCASTPNEPRLPSRNSLVNDELVIHTDFELPADHSLVEDLVIRRREISNLLGIPSSDTPIDVFLFDTPNEFRRYILKEHPGFPNRRALFVKEKGRLLVYAAVSPRLAEDLRHEVTHGYLHRVADGIPLWLDEGLAEFFEVERGQNGVNSAHVFLLKNELEEGRWRPNLVALEKQFSAAQMNQMQYAESWLWVHFLLTNIDANRKPIIQAHLHQLIKQGESFPISAAIDREYPNANEHLLGHLQSLSRSSAAQTKK